MMNSKTEHNPEDCFCGMSDEDLLAEVNTAIAVLQMSNNEDLAGALMEFVNRNSNRN